MLALPQVLGPRGILKMKQRWRASGYLLAAAIVFAASTKRGIAAAQAVAGGAQEGAQPVTTQEAMQVQPSNAAAVRTQQASIGLVDPAVQDGTVAQAPAGVVAPSADPADVVYTSDAYAPSDDPRQVSSSSLPWGTINREQRQNFPSRLLWPIDWGGWDLGVGRALRIILSAGIWGFAGERGDLEIRKFWAAAEVPCCNFNGEEKTAGLDIAIDPSFIVR